MQFQKIRWMMKSAPTNGWVILFNAITALLRNSFEIFDEKRAFCGLNQQGGVCGF